MNHLIKKIKEDKINKAVETLKGYCEKHSFCESECRFYDKKTDECVFEKGKIPCDWSVNNA